MHEKTGWTALGLAALLGWTTASSAQTVDKALFREDPRYIVKTVSEVHPAFVEAGRGEALASRPDALLRALPDEVPRWRVGVTVAELLRNINDDHTSTDLTLGSSRYLPLHFAWLPDGLIVAPVTGSKVAVPVASEFLKIGRLGVVAL